MKEVYLLRHAEKDSDGNLTESGKKTAQAMRAVLPRFVIVISSGSERTIQTAKLLTGEEPRIDQRAGYAKAAADVSEAIMAIANRRNMTFLNAAREFNDPDVIKSIEEKAHALNTLIDELLGEIAENTKVLVVSHDLTITPAMGFRGTPAESIEPLSGYIVSNNAGTTSIRRFDAAQN